MTLQDYITTETPTSLPDVHKSVSRLTFSWYDYILFCVMLVASVLIGIYFGCFGTRQASADEYLMGNKKMKVFPISVSLVASYISGITLLVIPADIYRNGASYWLVTLCGLIVVTITIYVYLPVFFKLQITTTYQYLERRFDSANRMFASFLFALSVFFYLPIVIYVPALAFSAATGINVYYIIPLVCGVCIFYTTIGGLKAVVWTDTLQFTIATAAVIAVVAMGVKAAGGVGVVWNKAVEGHRLDIFDFDPNPMKRDSFWIVMIGMSIHGLALCATNQSFVQKCLSVATLRESQLTIVYFYIGFSIVISFNVFIGLIMYSRYYSCDPFTTGVVRKNDQLLPYYIMDVASHIPGFSGLFIAGVFCAALSTLSACFNCLAGTIYEDFVSKWIGPVKKKKSEAYILKLLVIVIGIVCTAPVFIIEHLGGILPLALSLESVTSGPLLGMFTLGILFPKATRKGAFYGALIGLIFSGWIVAMAQHYQAKGLISDNPKPISIEGCLDIKNTTNEFLSTTLAPSISDFSSFNITPRKTAEDHAPFFLFRISFYCYTMLGTLVTVILGLLISYLFKSDDPPVHRDLLSPVIYFMLSEEPIVNERNNEYSLLDKALHRVTVNTANENTDEET